MKKLFFPVVLAATIILGGVLAYTIWTAKPLTAQAYYESGKKYYDEKKFPEAIIQLLNAVRKDPRNRDARFYLASSFMNQQDLTNAVGHLRALLEYYPDDLGANLQLGAIYLTAGRTNGEFFRQAQQISEKILARDPNSVGALILSGNASAGLQDYRTSVNLFERALGLDPRNLSAFLSLGTTQALQKNYAEAEQAFLKAREVNPKDKGALVSLGNYYRATKQFDKAEPIFKEAVELFPNESAIYLQLVEFYNQVGRFEEAEKLLHDVQAKTQDPDPSLILVDLYMAKDRIADARKLLLELKEKYPRNLDVSIKVATNFLQDQPDRAKAEIDQIIKADPKNQAGYVLLGELQFASGQYNESEATLAKDSVIDAPYPQVHFLLGNIAMRNGQVDSALFHYQKSLAVNGRYLPARVALAEVYLSKGRVADSLGEVSKALELRPDFVPARLLKASLDNAAKDYTGAEQELNSLAKEDPGNALIYRQMALYYDSRGRSADAEKSFMRALELRPDSQEILRDLVFFYIRTKQTDKVVQRINAIPDDKKQAFHYELLGVAYAQAGKRPEAEIAYKKALEKEPGRTTVNTFLVSNYMLSGRPDEALKVLDEMIKKNPSNTEAIGFKGQILQSLGKLDEAKQSYAQAVKANPNHDVAANNLAWILAEEGSDLNAALGYAQAAKKRQPESPDIADTLGWVYYKLGNYVLAREQVRFAISKDPDNAVFQYHMGMIYKQNKQLEDATAALKKAINNPKDFKEKSLAQAALKEIASLK